MSAIERPILITQPPQTKIGIRPKESDLATRAPTTGCSFDHSERELSSLNDTVGRSLSVSLTLRRVCEVTARLKNRVLSLLSVSFLTQEP
jgi:hypothetical protein